MGAWHLPPFFVRKPLFPGLGTQLSGRKEGREGVRERGRCGALAYNPTLRRLRQQDLKL
jgi:hypothetical protein